MLDSPTSRIAHFLVMKFVFVSLFSLRLNYLRALSWILALVFVTLNSVLNAYFRSSIRSFPLSLFYKDLQIEESIGISSKNFPILFVLYGWDCGPFQLFLGMDPSVHCRNWPFSSVSVPKIDTVLCQYSKNA